jgi:hypothetical protein
MKLKLLIENERYTSALSSTSSLKMTLVGQQQPRPLNPMKFKLLIEKESYTSALSSTASLKMALV